MMDNENNFDNNQYRNSLLNWEQLQILCDWKDIMIPKEFVTTC